MLRDRVFLFPRPQAGLELVGSSASPASAGRSLDRFYHFLVKGPGNMVEDSAQLGCRKLVPDVSDYESQCCLLVMIQGLPGSFSVSDLERRAATSGCIRRQQVPRGQEKMRTGTQSEPWTPRTRSWCYSSMNTPATPCLALSAHTRIPWRWSVWVALGRKPCS